MERIASFTVDHNKLDRGMYISRVDGEVTTYDIRTRKPNVEEVMENGAIHTLEHLFATFVRNISVSDKIVYFGPMGCRTGFYLLLAGSLSSRDIMPLMVEMFEFIRDFNGPVPGASPKDCGNYLDMNLPMANYWGKRYAALLENITDDRLVYPE